MTDQPFDFDTALEAVKSGKNLHGKDGVLTPMIKQHDFKVSESRG